MSARHKLNTAALTGVLIVAGLIAAVVGSWPLFWILVFVMLGTAIHNGSIRITPRKRDNHRPPKRRR